MSGKITKNIVIFGGTGDLTYRKLLPALYNLYAIGKIDSTYQIIAIGRRDYSTNDYINLITEWVEKYSRVNFVAETFEKYKEIISYKKLDFTMLDEYEKLCSRLCAQDIEENIFYLATAPSFFDIISDGINSLKCVGNAKIVVEKPFGETLEEASNLSDKLIARFGADNIYRIDHYLGKEMVQSINTIRFNNPIFRSCWDYHSIDHVHIIASEEEGIGTRGGYYDGVGALKDMMQNHLMQILSMVAMEQPDSKHDIKYRQTELMESLRPVEKLDIEHTLILGQYDGYRDENNVDENSDTETFAMCKLFIDNERWQGVPFYLATGKKLDTREMKIIITFRSEDDKEHTNILEFKIQPDEGVNLKFDIKEPGDSDKVIQAEMDFCQSCVLSHRLNTPEAYERLINAVMNSDNTWFAVWDQIAISWKYIEQLKEKYDKAGLPVHKYLQGSQGPAKMFDIIENSAHVFDFKHYFCHIDEKDKHL